MAAAKKVSWFLRYVATAGAWSARLASTVPIGAAAYINLQASTGWEWGTAAVCSTIFAAGLVEGAVLAWSRGRYLACLLVSVLASCLVTLNAVVALGNLNSSDTHAREVREAQSQASGNVADRRADAVRRRDEALSKLPKGETEASLTAAIAKEVKAKSTVWEASQHCSTENITLSTTKAFCGHIEDLNKQVAIAKEARDARDEIASIDKATSSVSLASVGIIATKSSVEAGAQALTNGLTRLGYHVTVDAISTLIEWGRAIGLEIVAAGSLTLVNALLKWAGGDETEAPVKLPKPSLRARVSSFFSESASFFKRKGADEVVTYTPGSVREFHRRYLEPAGPEDRVSGSEVQKRFKQYRKDAGVDTELKGRNLSQELRGLVMRYHETPGNRSYYYGVKWRSAPLPSVRPKGPHLAVDNTPQPVAAWG